MQHGLESVFRWVGPFKLRELLENCMNESQPWPQERAGVYLVSRHQWTVEPTVECKALYIGTNTGNSRRFLQRVGELVKDMLGFHGEIAGNHPGGSKLYHYCEREKIHPLDLYLAWTYVACGRCSENSYYDMLKPELNSIRPAFCSVHSTISDFESISANENH